MDPDGLVSLPATAHVGLVPGTPCLLPCFVWLSLWSLRSARFHPRSPLGGGESRGAVDRGPPEASPLLHPLPGLRQMGEARTFLNVVETRSEQSIPVPGPCRLMGGLPFLEDPMYLGKSLAWGDFVSSAPRDPSKEQEVCLALSSCCRGG